MKDKLKRFALNVMAAISSVFILVAGVVCIGVVIWGFVQWIK